MRAIVNLPERSMTDIFEDSWKGSASNDISASYDIEPSAGRGGLEVGVLAFSCERYAASYLGVSAGLGDANGSNDDESAFLE